MKMGNLLPLNLGETYMNATTKKIAAGYTKACLKTYELIEKYSTATMLILGVVLVSGGLVELSVAQGAGDVIGKSQSEAQFDDGLIKGAVGNLFRLIEGAFGALIMVVSGLGAIVAAAMGAYRAAVGMLVVAVGAFILRSLVSLFFGSDYTEFDGNN